MKKVVMGANVFRKDFPFFARKLVYLDTAATSQKPRVVLDAMRKFYEISNANVHRGVYGLADEATQLYEGARKTIARFINASPQEIVFVRNATEGINLVAQAWGRANIKKGETILITQMEHHSNIVPWQLLVKEKGANLLVATITKAGELDVLAFEKLLEKKPKLVAFTHVSNVLGTVNPVKELTALAHKAGAKVLVDACQSIAHMHVDVRNLNCDFLVFSGHKLYGPFVGVLYGKKKLLEEMPPFLCGGDMIKEVSFEKSSWNELPWKFEAGTPDVAGAVGLAAAVFYLEGIGLANVERQEVELVEYAFKKLQKIKAVQIYGPKTRAGVISFNLGDMHAHDVSTVLDEQGVCVRIGHHCAQPLMGVLGIPACARISIGVYTTKEDIDKFLAALQKAKKVFRL